MKTHTLTVRDRRLSWDDRRLTRDSVAVDEVAVDMDEEYRSCDTVVAVMVSAAHQDPVRMVVDGGRYRIPSEFTSHTGSILTCLIGYVGDVQRVTSEQESQPLVVTKSGPVCGTDPQDEQPDLWAQLIATVESAERIAQSVRDDADAGRFDGADGKTPVRGVDYWTPEDRKPIEDATLAATAAAGRADAAAATATEGEASRVAAEAARAEAELARRTAETGRVEAEATRAANESKRTETFNSNLVSWNTKVDAACKKATDTANKAAQDAKTATDAAVAKTEEATNAAVAKAQTATDNATTAANKAEAAVAKLPLPLGNTLKGEAEATLVRVDDAYPAPLVTTKVLGQSNQQQDPAPSPENPQEITNLNKAELVVSGKNLLDIPGTQTINYSNQDVTFTKDGEGYITSTEDDGRVWGYELANIKFPLKAGTYTFSCEVNQAMNSNYGGIRITRDGIDDIPSNFNLKRTTKQSLTFTLESDCKIGLMYKLFGARIRLQLEAGSKATTYEPHQSTVTPIDLKGNELLSIPNGVRDEVVIDAEGNVSLIKRVAKYVVPENVYAKDEVNNFGVQLNLNAVDNKYLHEQLCPENAVYSPSVNWLTVHKQGNYWANLQEFKQWLIGTEFYYGTKNPETIHLGKIELPALPEATSNIWNDGNIQTNVYIAYVRDANIVIGRLEDKLARVAYGNL